MIRLTVPTIEADDLEAVSDALASGFLVQGQRVAAFEEVVANRVGVKHAVAVSNATCALHLSLLALDVRPGDICVVTAYSWISTANVIELCGARPVFVDVDAESFNIDVSQLEEVLGRLMANPSTARRVKAVLPVHTFGQMVNMQQLSEVCSRWNLPVVEDAACALGASFHDRQAGTWGTLGCFSFHPRKAITTGEGGMITTSDDMLANRVRSLRNHGLDPNASEAEFVMPGHNYRLTEFQAALGSTQMGKLDRILSARRTAARRYDQLLAGTPLQAPRLMPGATHVYQSYVSLLPASAASRRSEMIRVARKCGVELQVGTLNMPMTTFFRNQYGYRKEDFPISDMVSARALTLPLFESLSEDDQRTVVGTVLKTLD
jgi:perosamine synthetase